MALKGPGNGAWGFEPQENRSIQGGALKGRGWLPGAEALSIPHKSALRGRLFGRAGMPPAPAPASRQRPQGAVACSPGREPGDLAAPTQRAPAGGGTTGAQCRPLRGLAATAQRDVRAERFAVAPTGAAAILCAGLLRPLRLCIGLESMHHYVTAWRAFGPQRPRDVVNGQPWVRPPANGRATAAGERRCRAFRVPNHQFALPSVACRPQFCKLVRNCHECI